MMTSELWDAVGQSERVVAGSSVGAVRRLEAGVLAGTERTCSDGYLYLGWMFVLSNCELGTSHVCWELVVSSAVSVVA